MSHRTAASIVLAFVVIIVPTLTACSSATEPNEPVASQGQAMKFPHCIVNCFHELQYYQAYGERCEWRCEPNYNEVEDRYQVRCRNTLTLIGGTGPEARASMIQTMGECMMEVQPEAPPVN
jgi:hypothetical protein